MEKKRWQIKGNVLRTVTVLLCGRVAFSPHRVVQFHLSNLVDYTCTKFISHSANAIILETAEVGDGPVTPDMRGGAYKMTGRGRNAIISLMQNDVNNQGWASRVITRSRSGSSTCKSALSCLLVVKGTQNLGLAIWNMFSQGFQGKHGSGRDNIKSMPHLRAKKAEMRYILPYLCTY